jgi:hypothetical protein
MSAESVLHIAPLGLRLWDEGTAAVVSDALEVSAALEGRSEVVHAARSASGQFVFHALPGLGGFDRGERGYDREQPPPGARRYVVTVTHRRGEFLPVRFVCEAPQWDLAEPAVATGPRPLEPFCRHAPRPSLPLFPAVSRAVGDSVAVVRAELHRTDDPPGPARWALVEASCDGEVVGRGLADAGGRVLLAFPYPPLDAVGDGQTPPPPSWQLSLSVYHERPPDKTEEQRARAARADLDAVMKYPRLDLRPAETGAYANSLTATLHPNRPLDLRALELKK